MLHPQGLIKHTLAAGTIVVFNMEKMQSYQKPRQTLKK
jgi:hypothetical protein